MDPSGDGGGGLTTAGLPCGSCGTELPPNSKFCDECGTPLKQAIQSAEYKQVTVLFADVVHSMDIAAAVGAERLREIMTDWRVPVTESTRFQSRVCLIQIQLISQATGVWVHLQAAAYSTGVR